MTDPQLTYSVMKTEPVPLRSGTRIPSLSLLFNNVGSSSQSIWECQGGGEGEYMASKLGRNK